MGGVFLFSLSMSLTSCEDILGHWEKPTPNPITPGGGSEGGGSSTINATAITLDQTMKVLVKGGDALTITATATPAEATLTWESSDEAVATVVNGVVTPVGNGITTITAKSGELSATCEVFVGNEVALSSLAYEAKNYDILKGDNGANSITIPDGFKVAFDGVKTTEGIVCSGDATIYLTDGSTNSVTAPDNKAGLQIGGTGKTLTINAETAGTGELTAKGGNYAAGIGTGKSSDDNVTGGDITINGGVIIATGGDRAAGIGTGESSGYSSPTSNQCGDITINGGTVTATGNNSAAGIGTGRSQDLGKSASQTCGDITIATGVTSVTAKRDGSGTAILIGTGSANSGSTQTCGKITFGTAEVYDGTTATGTWTPNPMVADTYGGLNLAISVNTWTLTPAAP